MKRGFVNKYQSVEKKSDEEQPRINKNEDGSVVLGEKAVFGGFLSLLPEVVVDIITNLLDLDQLIRFSVVSRYWNSLSSLPVHGNPWLIVPSNQSPSKFDCTCDATIGFFSPLSGKVYKLAVPQIKDHRICGSCPGGWLITVHGQGEIQILHPFSKAVISLPPSFELDGIGSEWNGTVRYDARRQLPAADIIRDAYIYKAVMSSTNPKFSVVMSIQGFPRKLVFCRVDENKRSYKRSLCGRDGISSYKKGWNLVKGNENEGISDVTFYCGQFYAIRNSGGVFVVEGWHFPSPYIKFVIDCPPYPMAFTKYYLVELLGELLCVMRFRFRSPEKPESPVPLTTFFKVSKLDLNGPKWIDVHNLGEDHALFIGFNQSFSFTTSDCQGFKGNSIFFGDDNYMENHQGEAFGGYDIGVFNMTRGIVEKCYPNVATPIMPPPIWFTTHAG